MSGVALPPVAFVRDDRDRKNASINTITNDNPPNTAPTMIPAYTGPLSGPVETKFCGPFELVITSGAVVVVVCGLLESVVISVIVVVVCEVNELTTVSVAVKVCERV